MPIHYLDASAWVKRYIQEEGSQRLNAWMSQNPLVVSAALGVTIVLSSIVRKLRSDSASGERIPSTPGPFYGWKLMPPRKLPT